MADLLSECESFAQSSLEEACAYSDLDFSGPEKVLQGADWVRAVVPASGKLRYVEDTRESSPPPYYHTSLWQYASKTEKMFIMFVRWLSNPKPPMALGAIFLALALISVLSNSGKYMLEADYWTSLFFVFAAVIALSYSAAGKTVRDELKRKGLDLA